MLELSAIKFSVHTDELVQAVAKIKDLGTAVDGLSTSIGKLDQKTAKANETQAKANLINAKASVELAKKDAITAKEIENLNKAELAETKLNQAKAKSAEVTLESSSATKTQMGLLEKQEAIYQKMTQGLSKGQATVMTYGDALGYNADQMKRLLDAQEGQRKLSGKQPFDDSMAHLKGLQNEYELLIHVQQQLNNESSLTRKQMEGLSSDIIREKELMKSLNLTTAEQTARLDKLGKEYTDLALDINKVRNAEIAAEKSTRDAAKANSYLESELQKVRFALQDNNAELTRGSSNAIVRFDNALKKSGLTLDQQKIKLDEYRKAQLALQTKTQADRTDYLTRAITPQITDIGVGLMTGQSPLTVLLQQGGQLRDQFGQFNVEADKMAEIMRNAMSKMGRSILDTGKAIGNMIGGGLLDAGKGLVDFTLKSLGVNTSLEIMKNNLMFLSMAGDKAATATLSKFVMLENVFKGFATGAILIAITAIITLGIELAKLIKQENELSNQLLLTGASLGMSKDQAVAYSEGLRSIGLTAEEARTTLTEFAKAGIKGGDSLDTMIKSAVDLEKYTGQSVEKTVAAYKKLQEDPVKALSELAVNTGQLNTQTLQHVATLVEQGKEVDAVSEAMKIMAEVNTEVATQAKENLAPITVLWIDIKKSISAVKDVIVRLGQESANVEILTTAFNGLKIVTSIVWSVLQKISLTIAAVAAALVSLGSGNIAGVNAIDEQWKADIEAVNKAQVDLNTQMEMGNQTKQKSIGLSAEEKKVNSEAATALLDIEKTRMKYMSDKDKLKLEKQKEINKVTDDYNRLIIGAGANERAINNLLDKRDKLISEINSKKDKKEPKSDAEKEAVRLEKVYQSALKQARDMRLEAEGHTIELTKAEIEMSKFMATADYKKLIPAEQEAYKLEIESAKQAEITAKAKETQRKLEEDILRIKIDTNKFIESEQNNSNKMIADQQLRLAMIGQTTEVQKQMKDAAEIEAKQSENNFKFEQERLKVMQKYAELKSRKDSETDPVKVNANLAALDAQSKAEIDKLEEQRKKNAIVINGEIAVRAAEDYYNEIKKISQPIADALSTALFEGGQAGTKQLRDYLVKVLREKITLNIEAFISGAIGDVVKGAVGGSGGASGTLSDISAGKGIYDAINGGFAALGAKVTSGITSFATSSAGASLGLSTPTVFAGPTAGSSAGGYSANVASAGTNSFASAAGTAAIAAAISYVGAEISMAISKGNKLFGIDAGTGGGILGAGFGLAARIFGEGDTKVNEKGIRGSIGASRTNTGTYIVTQQDRGWFGGDGIEGDGKNGGFTPDVVLNKQMSLQVAAITETVRAYAIAIGLSSGAIDSFTKTIDISTKDLTKVQIDEKLKELFTGFANDLSNIILSSAGPSQYMREGETAAATLNRLASSLITVNSAFTALNYSLLEISTSGAGAASNLIDAFGGGDSFASSLGSYFDNYFTAAEKQASSAKDLSKSLTTLGITKSPSEASKITQGDFRKIIDEAAKAIGTAEGDSRFAALVNLANKFKPLVDAAEELRKTFDNLSSSLEDEAKKIKGTVLGTGKEGQNAAQAAFELATLQARSGDQAAAASLPELSKNLLDLATNNAASLEELNRIKQLTADSLSATSTILKGFGITPPVGSSSVVNSTGSAYVGNLPMTPMINSQAGFVGPVQSSTNDTEVLIALEAVASMTNKNYKLLDGVINGENTLNVNVV